MEYLLDLFSGLAEDEGYQRTLFVGFVAAAVFLFLVSIAFIFNALFNPLRRRLNLIAAPAQWEQRETDVEFKVTKRESESELIEGSMKYILPQNDKERNKIQAQLIRTGYRDESHYRTFYAVKTLLALCFGVIAILATRWFPELSASGVLMVVGGASFFGLIIPNVILKQFENRRVREIRNGFPDALDLFVVCVEAGLGLDATIQRVAKELQVSHETLSEELDLVSAQTRLGIDRTTALRGLATRTGLDEIRGLVALLDQSARFGSSIAETLRVYSEEFRDKRTQQAEELAAKIGTKLIFPLTFCVWPSFFLVAIGPAIMKVMVAFQ